VQANGKSSSYTVEATIQREQVLSAPSREEGEERLFYFEELHPELQKVLTAQLQDSGDVSAVIESPGGFVVYQLKEKTTETLVVASLSISKLEYTQWLAELKL
jgi:hypothetical protein